MNESKKTIIFAGVALGIALLAFITTPRRVTPDAFLDKGELFFPDLPIQMKRPLSKSSTMTKRQAPRSRSK